ncbi:hypothetical protein L195_g049640, partial [Trifolium pratense]
VIESRLLRFNDAKALIHDVCHNEEREVAGRFAVMIWMLWNNRYDWLWNKEKKSATQIGTAWDTGACSIIEAEALAC